MQLTAGATITDHGLHTTGWFIVVVAAVLLVGIVASKNMGPRPGTAIRGGRSSVGHEA